MTLLDRLKNANSQLGKMQNSVENNAVTVRGITSNSEASSACTCLVFTCLKNALKTIGKRYAASSTALMRKINRNSSSCD
jgi:hypothetical protein